MLRGEGGAVLHTFGRGVAGVGQSCCPTAGMKAGFRALLALLEQVQPDAAQALH